MNVDTWQKGYAELSRQLANLKKEYLAMNDELIKLRRTYEDQIDNLTLDNMPSVREITLKTKDGVAGLVITVDDTVKKVEILTETVTEQGNSIASFESRASDLEAGIISIAEVQTEQVNSIAAIEQTADELDAEVTLAAEMATTANDNVSNGAYIIARVNEDASNVKIKADKVEIEGVVTFSDLQEKDKTTINGANIMTGTVGADRIAMNKNGQIDFSNLGSLDFLTESGASGSIRLNENEYGAGEIIISADMNVAVSGGGANFYLNEYENGGTEARIYANKFVMNGKRGVSGTYSIGGGSITVENGVVTNVVEGGGGGGGGESNTPLAPIVSINEDGFFTVNNPNGAGTLYYYTYWYDDYGGSEEGQTRTTSNTSVSGYADDYPPGGGWVGIYAHVIYNGKTSPAATDEAWFA